MSQTQFVGSWNESGMLLDIFRKGFTTANCISELIANCIDAEASNIFVEINPLIQKKYKIKKKKYKIDIHDDGIGMNLENLKNMFDMNNENHPDQKTMGIAGIGGKVSQAILSNKKNVYMFTRNTNGDEFYIYVPWKKIFIEKKFTNQIKIFKNYNKISENLIIEFNRIKNKLNHIKSGTIISIPINKDTIQDIDLALVMSVNPGFGGQSFIENTYSKVEKLKEMILRKNSSAMIEVDGGVTDKNAKKLVEAGADVLVAGSYVFKSPNPDSTIKDLKNLLK